MGYAEGNTQGYTREEFDKEMQELMHEDKLSKETENLKKCFDEMGKRLEALAEEITEALTEATKILREGSVLVKFGELKKGDAFLYQGRRMVKTARIKAGNDGAFYTAVSVYTGNHYCMTDDLEVLRIE